MRKRFLHRKGVRVFLIALLPLFAISASAQTNYYVSTAGNDLTGDGTIGNPYATIQKAVDISAAGDIVNIAAGTYPENVTVSKSLTIQGVDSATVILDKGDGNYNGNNGNNGFTVSANNVTIKLLKIRNYRHAVTNTTAVTNLTINQCTILDNFSTGFYPGASFSGLTISNCIMRYNGNRYNSNVGEFKRAVFLQAGSSNFSNLVLTNNIVTNNGLVGLDLNLAASISGVTITGNTLSSNGDAELSIWLGTSSPTSGAVLIDNNNITMTNAARFGIEIKNPNGTGANAGTGSVVVSNNTINVSGHTGATRDMGGIVVIRRKDATPTVNDQPQGVVISGNTINDMQNINSNTNDAYAIAVGGTGHKILNNTITNAEISIQLQKGNDGYLTDNNSDQALVNFYFSRDNSKDVCVEIGTNTITSSGAPRLVTGVATSSLTLPSIKTANTTLGATFCTIQQAIDFAATATGHTVTVQSGTYVENVILTKGVSLRGANYGINPNSGTRTAETILHPATSDPDPFSPTAITNLYITSTGNGATIDGFTFDGNNPSLNSGILINEGTTDVDACEAIGGYESNSNLTISNNIIKNINYAGIDLDTDGSASSGNVVTNNLFSDMRPSVYGIGVLASSNAYATISNNVMTGVRVGVQVNGFYAADPGSSHTISGNQIQSSYKGIWDNLASANASSWNITGNTITSFPASNNWGIQVSAISGTVSATIANNTISGARFGYNLFNNPTSNKITITGGTITGVVNGVVADNYRGYNTNAASSSYVLDGLTISASDTGILVLDDPLNTNSATVAVEIKGTTTITNAAVSLSVEGTDASATITGATTNFSGHIKNNSGTSLAATATTLLLNGTVAQDIQGGGNFASITLNNTAGATIAAGAGNTINITDTYTPTAGTLTTNGNLVLKSTATGTARIAAGTGTYISGAVTQERFVPAKPSRTWSLLASPFSQTIASSWQQQVHITGAGTGGTVCPTLTSHSNGFDATVTNVASMYVYDGTKAVNTRWTSVTGTTAVNLTPGVGYRVNVRGPRSTGCSLLDGTVLTTTDAVLSSTGTLSAANKNAGSFTMDYSNNADASVANDNYLLIGNPYPSQISFAQLRTDNSTKIGTSYAIYGPQNAVGNYAYWNGATFTGANTGLNNVTGDIIANGQAFFVQSAVAGGNITGLAFNETQKIATANNGYFRNQPNPNMIRIGYMLDNGNKADEIIIQFASNGTTEQLNEDDIISMNTGSQNLKSVKGARQMAINTRPLNFITDTVYLNVASTSNGTFKFHFSDLENLGATVYLVDRYSNTVQEIRNQDNVTFTVNTAIPETKGSNRFAIVFSKKQPIMLAAPITIRTYPNPVTDAFVLTLPETSTTYSVNLTDATGKMVKQLKLAAGNANVDVSKLAAGTYFMEVVSDKGNKTVQKIVKQ